MIPSKSTSAGLVIFRRKYSLAEILNTLHEGSYMKQPLVYQHMAFLLGTPIGRFHTSLERDSHFHLVKQMENFWKGGRHLRGEPILAGDWMNKHSKLANQISLLYSLKSI